MTRVLWFGLGIAAGVAASRKVRSAAYRMTPAGAAENLGDAVRELAAAVGSFGADVRAGMVQREAELHATVTARTGMDIASHLPDARAPRPGAVSARAASR
ncbi:MAG TPA: hypothetical protein VGL88_00775 [Pseudonocardiaceae bacterium]